jgi:hypothetical protein
MSLPVHGWLERPWPRRSPADGLVDQRKRMSLTIKQLITNQVLASGNRVNDTLAIWL